MLSLLSGVLLGWSLGANNAANIFGTAVSSNMVKFSTAVILCSVFVIIGALVSGQAGIETLKNLTSFTVTQAVISSVSAAVTVIIMTFLSLPASISQAVVGAIIGIGILNNQLNMEGLGKIGACWFGTPVGAALIAFILYKILGFYFNRLQISLFMEDFLLRSCLVISGCYGAYVLGANNVANVTAVFVGAGMINVFTAAVMGGCCIALGIISFSRPVMKTVGKKLVDLDPFSALVVSLSLAITINIYAIIGVPVSSSQAVIGGVLGVGIVKGASTVSFKTLKKILVGWFLTPVVACFFAVVITFLSNLKYMPPH